MKKNTILIIDDDPVTAAVIEEYLINSGFTVLKSQDGKSGIETMKNFNPDLILLDIVIPDKDGIQILTEIKLTSGFSSIPVLLLSSVNRTNIKVKGLELGADDYITKPVDKTELLARIRLSIKRSSQQTKKSGILEGELENFSIADILQSFELGKKTATISFTDMNGEIIIDNGIITHCNQGPFDDIKAINRLFFLEQGKFIVNFNNINKKDNNCKINIMNLLVKNVTYVDEVKLLVNSLPKNTKGIKITKELKNLTGLNIPESDNFIDINTIITKMERDLKENVELLIQINKTHPHIFNNTHSLQEKY